MASLIVYQWVSAHGEKLRKLQHMHTRTCICGVLCGLRAAHCLANDWCEQQPQVSSDNNWDSKLNNKWVNIGGRYVHRSLGKSRWSMCDTPPHSGRVTASSRMVIGGVWRATGGGWRVNDDRLRLTDCGEPTAVGVHG